LSAYDLATAMWFQKGDPTDPGHPNWIDTAGLSEGIVAIRCLLPQRPELPAAEAITLDRSDRTAMVWM
ncbi:MAG: hypothetical protein ACR2JM_03420, partial [Mycobacterium sp.]